MKVWEPTQEPPPPRIPIALDDHHASRIGRLPDGRQFFVTTPFVPAQGGAPGRDFLAVFLFDAEGALLEARIDDLGPDGARDEAATHARRAARLGELGPLEPGDVALQPFRVERFGVTFGLIAHPPAYDGDGWWVEMHPGNYMAFHEPWNGAYDS